MTVLVVDKPDQVDNTDGARLRAIDGEQKLEQLPASRIEN